ncbi:hypothetical protein ACN083_05885 [Rothia sp. CCM 9418]|uniref:hypothetical protein n=1 Tax=Rothia sp. CCM 9418 TaxID=3402661 RepID=UPI003AEECC49
MQKLSTTLKEASQQRSYSIHDITNRAHRLGYKVGKSTVHRYLSGQLPEKPNNEVLKAFAEVLSLDFDNLLSLAGKPQILEDPFILPREASALNRRERQAVLAIVNALLDSKAETIKALNQTTTPAKDPKTAIKRRKPTAEDLARAELYETLEKSDLDLAVYRHSPDDELDYDSYN